MDSTVFSIVQLPFTSKQSSFDIFDYSSELITRQHRSGVHTFWRRAALDFSVILLEFGIADFVDYNNCYFRFVDLDI